MHLTVSNPTIKQRAALLLAVGAVLAGLLCALLPSQLVGAQAAQPVSYTISPAASSVRPDGTINITLTIRTDVELAGASVHLTFGNGAYAGFQSVESNTFSFVDYHENYNDIVFICNNNSCLPGTYQIGTVVVRAGTTGSTTVGFVPKETADPALQLLGANGATGNYDISSSAPASPTRRNPSTFTIPKDSGIGGTTPLQITNDQFVEQTQKARENYQETISSTIKPSTWSLKNILLLGLAIGASFALFVFVIFRFTGRTGGSRMPRDQDGSGTGPTAIVG